MIDFKENLSLLDTNVLLYRADETSSFYYPSKKLIDRGLTGEVNLCVCPQVLKEFFRVITDPKLAEKYSLGLEEAIKEIEKYLSSKNINP